MSDNPGIARGPSNVTRPLVEAGRKLFPPLDNRILAQAANALAQNRTELAGQLLSGFLGEHPGDPAALNLMADIARRAERHEEAEQILSQCIEQSDCAGYRFNYAVILRRLGKFEQALAQIDKLLAREPQNPLFREQKAKILHDLDRHAEALVCREELAKEFPAAPEIWLLYGDSLRWAGFPDRCVAAYRKGVDLAPRLGAVYPRLANLRGYRFTANDTEWLEKQLASSSLPSEARASLHFVLGNAYGDQKIYTKSFDNYATANALQRAGIDSDPQRLTAFRQMCETLFSEEFFRERERVGCPSDSPIFIVGMPRSGSTLLEQILSAHSAIEGLGEIPDFLEAIDELFHGAGNEHPLVAYRRAVSRLSAADWRSRGEMYLQLCRPRQKLARPFFTDKSGSNFTNVGLIHLMLPKAKIIDARRHPLDCGWSCFRSYFPGGQAFSHDLGDIGRHYADYARLMAHFDQVVPGRIHRVLYEDLVANPETEVRRLFEYLGLPFEDQCLRFHESQRTVKTLSGDQVRQPLYSSGVGQWLPYEPWLEPLKAALGPVLDCYPNVPD